MEKYEKVRVLGKGSFGSAILIKRKSDGSLFVVKEVSLGKMSKKERDEARHECTVLQQLHHPNIVRYVEQFENRNNLYIVMEYCDGGDLAGKVKQARGPMKESTVLYYFSQVCLAMEYLHSRHILHRDIKTMNVFLMKSGAVKLGDFGISTVLRNTMGMANTVCGTPYYFSPELCRNRPYNNKSDIWALGVLLYECATGGRHPFDGNSMNQLMQRIVKGSYPALPSHFSAEFRKMVDWCLQKEPSMRPSIKQTLALPIMRHSLEQLEENLMLATQCRVRLKDIIDFEPAMDSNGSGGKDTPRSPQQSVQKPLPGGVSPGQAAAMAMAKNRPTSPSRAPQPPARPASPGRAASPVVGPKPSAPHSPAAAASPRPSNAQPPSPQHKPHIPQPPQVDNVRQGNESPRAEAKPPQDPRVAASPNNGGAYPSKAGVAAAAPDRFAPDIKRVDAIIAKYGQNADPRAKETIHAYMRRKQEEYAKRQKDEQERRERRDGLRHKELERVLAAQRGVAAGKAERAPAAAGGDGGGGNDGRQPSPRDIPPATAQRRQSKVAAAPAEGRAGGAVAQRRKVLAANSPFLLADQRKSEAASPTSRPVSRQRRESRARSVQSNPVERAERARGAGGAGGRPASPSVAGGAAGKAGAAKGNARRGSQTSPKRRLSEMERERAARESAERELRERREREFHAGVQERLRAEQDRERREFIPPRSPRQAMDDLQMKGVRGPASGPRRPSVLAALEQPPSPAAGGPRGMDAAAFEAASADGRPSLSPRKLQDGVEAPLFNRASPRLKGEPRLAPLQHAAGGVEPTPVSPSGRLSGALTPPPFSPSGSGGSGGKRQPLPPVGRGGALPPHSPSAGARPSRGSSAADRPRVAEAELIDLPSAVVGHPASPSARSGASDGQGVRRKSNADGDPAKPVSPASGEKQPAKDLQPLYIPSPRNNSRALDHRRQLSSEAALYAGMAREPVSEVDQAYLQRQKLAGASRERETTVPSMLETLRGLRQEKASDLPAEEAVSASDQLSLLKQRKQQQQQQHGPLQPHEPARPRPISTSGDVRAADYAAGRPAAANRSPLPSPSTPAAPVNALSLGALNQLRRPSEIGGPAQAGQDGASSPSAMVDRRSSVDGYAEMLQHLKDLLQKRRVHQHPRSRPSTPGADPASPTTADMSNAHSPPHLSHTKPVSAASPTVAAAATPSLPAGGAHRPQQASPTDTDDIADEDDEDFEDAVPLSPVRYAELNDSYSRMMQHAEQAGDVVFTCE